MSFSLRQTVLALALVLWSTATLVAAGTNDAGLTFLAENKMSPGVVALPSGLQYKVLKKGKGFAHPAVNSPCSCHYEGKLLDGTVFDSSYERGDPTTFAPNQVIKGWTEAMQLMVVGDKVSGV
jgi:FKBP-type peptidyl-prolyl cis-trans isomerase FklB